MGVSRTTCVYRKPRSGAKTKNIYFKKAKLKTTYRDVAQMVARHVRDVDAAGSTPVISTKKTVSTFVGTAFFFV